MPKGYLMMVLHAHLPYVHHPEYDRFLEERWFFEAVTETYIPLIKFFDRLRDEGIRFRMTLSISPSLAAMLEDPHLCDRCLRHLEMSLRLAEAEIQRTQHWPEVNRLAHMYRSLFAEARQVFVERAGKRLLQVFREFEQAGLIELMTCASTHAYLPGLSAYPGSIRAQVFSAVDEHERIFGRKPKGFWMPECGYFPGVDQVLTEAGLRYSFVESHGIEHASPKPLFGPYAPLYCPSGLAVFGRLNTTSKLVWSSMVGYPADARYREYYRDIGYDLDQGYLAPYEYAPGVRTATGIKYHRITGPGKDKHLYDPDRGREAAQAHAHDFVNRCREQARHASHRVPFPAALVSPYDAELFGHWWFEGPQWLYYVLRELAQANDDLQAATPSEYLAAHPVHQRAVPSPSSWGRNGYSEQWINQKTQWIWQPMHEASGRMSRVLTGTPILAAGSLEDRAMRQAARELMLVQDSDWPFAITNGTTEVYAKRRFLDHLSRFHELLDDVEHHQIDAGKLAALELMDGLLPKLDYRLFSTVP
jgi:1,4-alpha-glucan branching enzyme